MKINTKDIRSIEVIQKPDGKYFRIGYAKKQGPAKKAKGKVKETWRNNTVKTIIIAAAAVIAYNLLRTMAGM